MSPIVELAERRGTPGPTRLFDEGQSGGWEGRAASLTLDGEGGESTLDELLAGVWERLTVHAVARCPVCQGHLGAEPAQSDARLRGRCRDCAATFS